METRNLYFLKSENGYLLKKTDKYFLCLEDADILACGLGGSTFEKAGVVEENQSVLYTLFTGFATLTNTVSNVDAVPESVLFTKELRPGDKMFMQQIINGLRDINLVTRYSGERLVTAYDRRKINPFLATYRHLHTVNHHRRLVRKGCFKVGLYWQGIIHDLSKYMPVEFFTGVKYYQGMRSPNVAERMTEGYSKAWMHHKGRNRHHQEYWTDYSIETGNILEFMPMPKRYLVESIMDRIAACKVYRGSAYNDGAALDYLLTRDSETHMNKDNYEEMVRIFTMLKEQGEDATCKYLKEVYLKEK